MTEDRVERMRPDRMMYLKDLGIDPAKVDLFEVRCMAEDGRDKTCGIHIATVQQETIGRVLRVDPEPKGYVVLDLARERTFSGQRFFAIHCQKHPRFVFSIAGDVDTVYSERYSAL